jgi:hypothetical protein|tara:strand:+ start:303 stop:542 length:240 start_codon:yes stop_codon:yes gene_type:complete
MKFVIQNTNEINGWMVVDANGKEIGIATYYEDDGFMLTFFPFFKGDTSHTITEPHMNSLHDFRKSVEVFFNNLKSRSAK